MFKVTELPQPGWHNIKACTGTTFSYFVFLNNFFFFNRRKEIGEKKSRGRKKFSNDDHL